jgi:hypothetical protein
MKFKMHAVAGVILATILSSSSLAQGFGGQGSKYIQLGLGVSQHFSTYNDYNGHYNYQYGGFYFQMEFGIHKYVGLGFGVGIEGAFGGAKYYYNGTYAAGYVAAGNPYKHLGIPVYFQANFHFLQLIADKNGKDFADKLDVYGGLNIGGGPVFRSVRSKYKNDVYYTKETGLMYFFGPHVGCRFFPKENIGIYAEVGYGKQLGNLGVVFKL